MRVLYFILFFIFLSSPFAVDACTKYYTVMSGDLCYLIAQNNGLDVNGLIALNSGLNCYSLQIGQKLCLAGGSSSSSCTKYYSVISGDICWNIINKYGITLAQLTSFNPGLNCNNLQVGQNLCVTQGSTPTPIPPTPTPKPTPTPSPTPTGSITIDQFTKAVTACGFGAPSNAQYTSFVARAPTAGGITSKRELAMFLAEILHESGGLVYKRELNCLQTNCPNDYRSPGDAPNLFYFGRGFIQLSWSYNYRMASQALFGDDRLVTNPDLVAQTDDYSWAVSFWFWKANVHDKVQGGQFGSATNAINGGLECSPCRAACPTRFSYYSKILPIFGVTETPNSAGC